MLITNKIKSNSNRYINKVKLVKFPSLTKNIPFWIIKLQTIKLALGNIYKD